MDSGATSIMSSYNSYDGIPVVADSYMLTDILRGEWGYEYYVISDAGGTARLDNAFHVCGHEDHECITLEVCQDHDEVDVPPLTSSLVPYCR